LISADKSFLTERVGTLTASAMERVESGLRLVLDL
jgi:hypothetical protein